MLFLTLIVVHLFFAFSWFAGLFYLPRLLIYHLETKIGSNEDKRFKIMERRLLRYIMTPSMLLVLAVGIELALTFDSYKDLWLQVKTIVIILLVGYHMLLGSWVKSFRNGNRTIKKLTLRIANEFPTVMLIIIIVMAVFKFS